MWSRVGFRARWQQAGAICSTLLTFWKNSGEFRPGNHQSLELESQQLGGRKAHTSLSSADMHTVSCRFSLCAVELPASCAGAAVRAPASHSAKQVYIYVCVCVYLGVRHAACGKGNARWNAVVCVESGVRLWGAALRFGMRRSCLEFSEKAWNSAQKVEFSENAWNSAQKVEFGRSTLEFEFHIGIPGFTVEFSQKARNSRNSVESAGVLLVMWAVAKEPRPTGIQHSAADGRTCGSEQESHLRRRSPEWHVRTANRGGVAR